MIEVKMGSLVIEIVNPQTNERKFPVLEALNAIASEKVTFKTSRQISKIIKQLDEEIALYREAKLKLFKEYGDENKDENGNVIGYNTKPEHQPKVEEELRAMNDIVVKIDCEKLPDDDFKNVNIAPHHTMVLDSWLFQ